MAALLAEQSPGVARNTQTVQAIRTGSQSKNARKRLKLRPLNDGRHVEHLRALFRFPLSHTLIQCAGGERGTRGAGGCLD